MSVDLTCSEAILTKGVLAFRDAVIHQPIRSTSNQEIPRVLHLLMVRVTEFLLSETVLSSQLFSVLRHFFSFKFIY